jgi:hypothetical protein
MYRIPGVLSSTTTAAPAVPRVRPTRGPPPAPEDGRERTAADLNDIVIRRLLAAGLDLQGALELLGDHPASVKISHATEELNQAISDIRDTISRALAGDDLFTA